MRITMEYYFEEFAISFGYVHSLLHMFMHFTIQSNPEKLSHSTDRSVAD